VSELRGARDVHGVDVHMLVECTPMRAPCGPIAHRREGAVPSAAARIIKGAKELCVGVRLPRKKREKVLQFDSHGHSGTVGELDVCVYKDDKRR
jgi:hypothetical protein